MLLIICASAHGPLSSQLAIDNNKVHGPIEVPAKNELRFTLCYGNEARNQSLHYFACLERQR